jgi:hypothetical protein
LEQVALAQNQFLESPLLGEGALVEADAFAAGAIELATKIADATGKQVVRAFAFHAMEYVFSMVSWIFRMIGYQ